MNDERKRRSEHITTLASDRIASTVTRGPTSTCAALNCRISNHQSIRVPFIPFNKGMNDVTFR